MFCERDESRDCECVSCDILNRPWEVEEEEKRCVSSVREMRVHDCAGGP